MPASAATAVYVALAAPLMATPSRFHWYASETGAGAQVPADAVSTCPTCAVPAMVGTGVSVSGVGPGAEAEATLVVYADVFVTEVYPAFVPVTDTEIGVPCTAAVGVYVAPVAPVIAPPELLH